MSIDDHRWCFMRSMVLVTPEGREYLARMRVVGTPWCGIYVHRLDVPDPGHDLHDHPWPFVSIVLRGGYIEERCDTRTAARRAQRADASPNPWLWPRGRTIRRRAGTAKRMRLTECHRIVRLYRSPTWTLVLVGRRSRSWGFYQPDGYVDHNAYDFAVRRFLREEAGD